MPIQKLTRRWLCKNDFSYLNCQMTSNELLRAIGESFNRPDLRNPSDWVGKLEGNKLGVFTFKNRQENEPLDLVSTQMWSSWGIDTDKCKICDGGPYSSTYEISLEWGDTKKYEYI